MNREKSHAISHVNFYDYYNNKTHFKVLTVIFIRLKVIITNKAELKRKLKSSWVLSLKVKELHYQLQELEATGTKVTPSYSLAPAGGGDNNTSKPEQAALAVCELKQKIINLIEKHCAALNETYDLIDLLDDETLKTVMIMRYTRRKPWEKIAAEMGYSWRQVHRFHGRALNAILTKCK